MNEFYEQWIDIRRQNHFDLSTLTKDEKSIVTLYDTLEDLRHCLETHLRTGLISLQKDHHLIKDIATRLMGVGQVKAFAQKVHDFAQWLHTRHQNVQSRSLGSVAHLDHTEADLLYSSQYHKVDSVSSSSQSDDMLWQSEFISQVGYLYLMSTMFLHTELTPSTFPRWVDVCQSMGIQPRKVKDLHTHIVHTSLILIATQVNHLTQQNLRQRTTWLFNPDTHALYYTIDYVFGKGIFKKQPQALSRFDASYSYGVGCEPRRIYWGPMSADSDQENLKPKSVKSTKSNPWERPIEHVEFLDHIEDLTHFPYQCMSWQEALTLRAQHFSHSPFHHGLLTYVHHLRFILYQRQLYCIDRDGEHVIGQDLSHLCTLDEALRILLLTGSHLCSAFVLWQAQQWKIVAITRQLKTSSPSSRVLPILPLVYVSISSEVNEHDALLQNQQQSIDVHPNLSKSSEIQSAKKIRLLDALLSDHSYAQKLLFTSHHDIQSAQKLLHQASSFYLYMCMHIHHTTLDTLLHYTLMPYQRLKSSIKPCSISVKHRMAFIKLIGSVKAKKRSPYALSHLICYVYDLFHMRKSMPVEFILSVQQHLHLHLQSEVTMNMITIKSTAVHPFVVLTLPRVLNRVLSGRGLWFLQHLPVFLDGKVAWAEHALAEHALAEHALAEHVLAEHAPHQAIPPLHTLWNQYGINSWQHAWDQIQDLYRIITQTNSPECYHEYFTTWNQYTPTVRTQKSYHLLCVLCACLEDESHTYPPELFAWYTQPYQQVNTCYPEINTQQFTELQHTYILTTYSSNTMLQVRPLWIHLLHQIDFLHSDIQILQHAFYLQLLRHSSQSNQDSSHCPLFQMKNPALDLFYLWLEAHLLKQNIELDDTWDAHLGQYFSSLQKGHHHQQAIELLSYLIVHISAERWEQLQALIHLKPRSPYQQQFNDLKILNQARQYLSH